VPKTKDDLVTFLDGTIAANFGHDELFETEADALAECKRLFTEFRNQTLKDSRTASPACAPELEANWREEDRQKLRVADAALVLCR